MLYNFFFARRHWQLLLVCFFFVIVRIVFWVGDFHIHYHFTLPHNIALHYLQIPCRYTDQYISDQRLIFHQEIGQDNDSKGIYTHVS
jgi:hypothetical protein